MNFYVYTCIIIAPDDYETLMTTLTFREGTNGSRPSEAACISVFIFEDPYPEETETLSFHIRSPNTSKVRIMEGRGQNNVFIRDNDGVCFQPLSNM